MNAGAVVKGRRGDDEFMNGLLSQPALLRLFQTTRKQLEVFFPSRYSFRFYKTVDIAVVVSRNRLLLVAGGRLCATVACRLLCLPGQRAIGSALIHARAIVSRRHFFYEASATCVATLARHSSYAILSVAFDPTGRFVATGSHDNTVKVWKVGRAFAAFVCFTPHHFESSF
jgi:WD40 repeat protein